MSERDMHIDYGDGFDAGLEKGREESAAEIAALKHQVSEQALKYLSAMGQWDELEADLRQRLEVAERDAARYQWLRGQLFIRRDPLGHLGRTEL